jgi:hypothetical protein
MKHIKLFENYLSESTNSEALESPEMSNGVDTEEYLVKAKGEKYKDRDNSSEYFMECKQFASSLSGKSMKVPHYGMVSGSNFKFEGFADCCFAIATKGKGAGVWNNAIRREESKLSPKHFPTVFVAGYVTKDKGFADMDFRNTPNKTLTPALSGYYCYINIHKRIGSDLSLESTEEKFTMQELVALDPQWKVYFQGLCDIADKYGSRFN